MGSPSKDRVYVGAGDSTDDGGGGYAGGLVVFLFISIAVAVLAGTYWRMLLEGTTAASALIAIVVGYVRIRRSRSGSRFGHDLPP